MIWLKRRLMQAWLLAMTLIIFLTCGSCSYNMVQQALAGDEVAQAICWFIGMITAILAVARLTAYCIEELF